MMMVAMTMMMMSITMLMTMTMTMTMAIPPWPPDEGAVWELNCGTSSCGMFA